MALNFTLLSPLLILLLLILGFEGIRFIFKISGRKLLELGVRPLKILFLFTIVIDFALSIFLWYRFQDVRLASYVLSGTGWTTTLTNAASYAVRPNILIDILSATVAVITSLIALIACLRAMSDKDNPLTPMRIVFFLMTLCGVRGMLFCGEFFNLFLFAAISQIGASGLARQAPHKRTELAPEKLCYFISRFLLLLMLFCGSAMLVIKYHMYSFLTMSSVIQLGNLEKAAFALIVSPLLYLFIKPPLYTTDSASRCCFAIRALAAFFVLFRVVFFLYGVMEGLERIPALLGAIGILAIFVSLLFSVMERDPIKLAAAIESTLKGFMLIAFGTALSGVYSAAAVADYGYGALEALMSLLLLFLPVSAALSVTSVHLKQEVNGCKLWLTGGHASRLGFTGLLFSFAVFILGGLPPFTGFAAHQFLYRSTNTLNPFLMLVLFIASISIMFIGLRYIALIMFGRRCTDADSFKEDSAILLPLALLFLMITSASMTPGSIHEKVVSPSVNFLISHVRHAGSQSDTAETAESGEVEQTGGEYEGMTENFGYGSMDESGAVD